MTRVITPSVEARREGRMTKAQRFSYRNLDQILVDLERLGINLPISHDFTSLAQCVKFGRKTVPNRLAIHPMEGCDGLPDGSPGDLTIRRYKRFAAGGAGLIWLEACAVVPEGKANPRQISLTDDSAPAFKRMLDEARSAAMDANGYAPIFILQLTHSGRYSRPIDKPSPIIAHHSRVLDNRHNLDDDYPLITDEQLDELQLDFVKSAQLARQVGFDGVDIKSCHRYLLSELLASFTREDSRYGGSYENRTRMLLETAKRVIQAVGHDIEVTSRLNVYDAIEYPFGWGVSKDDVVNPDLSEPTQLIKQLMETGYHGINVSIANPYFNPYVNRPADWMIANWPAPPEHPLEGVARLIGIVRDVQQANREMVVVGTGYSWLRQYMPFFAAGAIEQGWTTMVGLGRGALAYPDFARDILTHKAMDPHKVCVACSSCTQIMRDGGMSGCVVRDSEVYAPVFRDGRRNDPSVMRELAGQCRRCADPMCQTACPAGVDIPGFIGAIADGDEALAYRILTRDNVLPGICGAVCPVEVQCQSACIQRLLGDGAVPIGELQRRLSVKAIAHGWAGLKVPAVSTGLKVAVVGAGPGGLAAAVGLLKAGHVVTVIDRGNVPGGKLGSIIPATRLSPADAKAEIEAVFADVPADRLTWRHNTALGPKLTVDDLLGEGFNAVVLALGLGNGVSLTSVCRPEGVMDGDAFLRHTNQNPRHKCPPRVAVIGGGNTAIDAAVAAKRHGAQDVYLLYRRSYEQMPSWPNERDEALHEGVHLMLLCQPTGYKTDDGGRVTGIKALRTQLVAAESGRRAPKPIPGSDFVMDVDMVIEALGERIDPIVANVLDGIELTSSGLIKIDPHTLATSRNSVWAVGDVVNGGMTVVQAVADGKRAAERIDAYLMVDKRK